MIQWLIVVGCALQTDGDALEAKMSHQVPKLLAHVKGKIDLMTLRTTPRLEELTAKLQAAAQEDPEWFQEHAREAKPGEPLPYDEKLGLTRAEYRDFLKLAKQTGLVKAREVTVELAQDPEGVFTFQCEEDLPALHGVKINLKNAVVATPFGTCDQRSEIHTPPGHTFPWDGYAWALEATFDPETNSGKLAKFHVGRLRNSNRGILYYKAKRVEDGALIDSVDVVITYPLPAK
ncbi:MAG: hypothetical protein HYY16_15235 [Planctomycetes bacterium]|nr:hypothetical protein [Planctomycetota bacterium]